MGLFIAMPIILVDKVEGANRLSLDFVLGLDALFALTGTLLLFVSIVIDTRFRKNDPFRFSRVQKAYFNVPVAHQYSVLSKLFVELRKVFDNCEQKSPHELVCVWIDHSSPPALSGSPVSRRALAIAGKIERKITIAFKKVKNSSDHISVEISAEPKSPLAQTDAKNANLKAIEKIVALADWRNFQISTDLEGVPLWPSQKVNQ
jgi:hypothetical protein